MHDRSLIIKYVKKVYQIFLIRLDIWKCKSWEEKNPLYAKLEENIDELKSIIPKEEIINNNNLYEDINTGLKVFNLKMLISDDKSSLWITYINQEDWPMSMTII